MYKKLLISVSLLTALVAAPSFSEHTIAKSDDWEITAGADVNLQAGGRFQSTSKTKQYIYTNDAKTEGAVVKIGPSGNNSDMAFMSAAHAYLGAKNKTKNGLKYGVQVGLVASTRGNLPIKDHLGRTYGYFEHNDWGRVELGTKKGASRCMQIDGDEVAAGTGGFNGDWGNYMRLTYYTSPAYTAKAMNEDNFADDTKLVLKDNDSAWSNGEGMRKITYYTPKYKGFQFGISYAPDEANRGGNDSNNTPFNKQGPNRKIKNAFMAGISYEKEIDKKQKFKIALVGETGTLVRSAYDIRWDRHFEKNPKGFDIGAVYTYDKFSIAGSYGDRGKFKYRKKVNPKRTIFYTAGIGYQHTDKIKTSLSYYHSDNKNKLDIFSVGADYNWLPGVQPYAEVTHVIAKQKYDYDPRSYDDNKDSSSTGSATNSKNRGTVLMIGTRFSF